ncbi:hypothetical protein QWZ06_16525 [Chryseobacterium tructae]|nr:hypothetical protein [Chryseobacterium tructae]MDN3693782.1 hypothetical protein [Chryseobacterium tructae]
MDDVVENNIQQSHRGNKVSVLAYTRNYEEGETVSLKVIDKNGKEIKDGEKELTLSGTVDKEGYVILKEAVEIPKNQNSTPNG